MTRDSPDRALARLGRSATCDVDAYLTERELTSPNSSSLHGWDR
jgi:hypothetical protein